MSATYTQLLDLIDENAGTDDTSYSKASKTRDINLALDKALALIFQVGGTWQFDDSGHTDYPIITTDLNSGQRDYPFTTDGSGNLILEIYKVFVADSNGTFHPVYPRDVPKGAPSNYYDGLDVGGQPTTYDKLGNGIFLNPIPNYDQDDGLKIYINREALYFTTSDTTKKAGIAGLFHEYLALRPAFQYAYRKNLPNTNRLEGEVLKMEADIQDYYKSREKDVQKAFRGRITNAR